MVPAAAAAEETAEGFPEPIMERKRGRLQADQSPGVITETDGLDLPMVRVTPPGA